MKRTVPRRRTVPKETGDLALAMQFVGDRDLSQAPSYVKDRMDRFDDAAERLDAADATEAKA